MHEVSIAQELCSVIEQSLGCRRPLSRVTVTIGPLSGILPEALEFCFCSVAEQMGFGNPQLCITRTQAKIRCTRCETLFETDDFYSLCPSCSSFEREILSGCELLIDSVEVEEE